MRKFIILSLCVFIISCSPTTYYGVKPIPLKTWDETTDTRPIFRWEAYRKSGVLYDFVIYELVELGENKVPGKTIYYKEGLRKNQHRIDFDLEKGESYLWSVRIRDGSTTGRWSTFDKTFYYPYMKSTNYPYTITILDYDSKPDYYKNLP